MKRKMIPLMFIGERLTHQSRVVQSFKDMKGNIHNWTGRKFVWTGCVVESIVFNGNWTMEKTPAHIQNHKFVISEKDQRDHELHKVLISDFRQKQRKLLSIKKPHQDILQIVNLLTPFLRGTPYYDRERLFRWIENECDKKRIKNPTVKVVYKEKKK